MESQQRSERRIGRAAFLGVTAAGLSSLLWARPAWDFAASALPRNLSAVLPQPTSGWRIYTVAASMPEVDRAAYRLTVEGDVGQGLELSLDDLRALPAAEQVSDFRCVTGWSVRGVRWRGVRVPDVLAAAAPKSGSTGLAFISAESPYVDSLTLEQAALPDVLLAWEMDGLPLTRAHGAPLRLVVPRMYGYKSVKWVERIVVTQRPADGYWEQRGYDRDAWIGHSNAA